MKMSSSENYKYYVAWCCKEIDLDRFGKYAKIDIENLKDLPQANFISDIVHKMSENIDEMYYKFLTENGYKVDRPYNVEQLKQIKKDLEKQDTFIDYLEYTDFDYKNNVATHYLKPFFNSISNPLTQETREELIRKWKLMNSEGKNE